MIIRNISNSIQETLKNRERALSRKTIKPNESNEEGTLHYGDLASRSTFVTMASANGKGRIIQGGELQDGIKSKFGFDSTGGKDGVYQNLQMGSSGEGYRPISGISNISVIYKGGYKAIREATVSWVANSFTDLDDLTPAFLTVGKSVLLEWGWVFSNPKINRKILENSFIVRDVNTFTFHPDVFEDPQARIEAADGNFDALFGTVSNFDYQLNDSGGFNCTTKIVSTGVNMFESQNSQAKSPEVVTVDKQKENVTEKESKASMDGLVSSILNLEKIFFLEVAELQGDRYGWDGTDVSATTLANKDSRLWSTGFRADKNFRNNPNIQVLVDKATYGARTVHSVGKTKQAEPGARSIYQLGTEQEIFFQSLSYYDTSNVMHQSEDFFVSFGWLEDNLFTRYLSYSNTVGGEILNTFRSIEPERDGNGAPILNYGKTSEGFEIQLGPDGNYYYMDADGKKQNLSTPPDSNDDPSLTRYKNRSVLIRSHPKLLPIDPMKFFLPGQNIPSTAVSIIDVVMERQQEELREHLQTLFNINSDVGKQFLDLRYDDSQYGRLRRVMINTKELKKAFGIDVGKTFRPNDNNGRIFKDSEVKPPKSIKEGIKRLLTNLSANFHDYWNFEIVADTINTNNMKVVDTNSTPEFDQKLYSEFKDNSHKIKKRGVFKFPAYTLGSIVKSQELAFKIPDSQAISAMYGSNQRKKGGTFLDTSNENSILQAVFANDSTPGYEDTRFQGMEKATKLITEGGHKIGAKNISEKITFEGSVEIEPGTEWWSSFSSTLVNSEPQTGVVSSGRKKRKSIYEQAEYQAEISKFSFNQNLEKLLSGDADGIDKQEIEELEKKIEAVRKDPNSYEGGKFFFDGGPFFRTLTKAAQRDINDLNGLIRRKRTGGFGGYYLLKPATTATGVDSGFQISLFTSGLTIIKSHLYSFDKDSAVYQSNYLIPAELSLTVDGIGGMLPGEIIQTDYIQAKYNTNIKDDDRDIGPFAFFQIFGIEQKLDANSWDTSITTKMRVNNNVLEMDAKDVIRIITEDKKASLAPVEGEQFAGDAQIAGQFGASLMSSRGAKYGPEGNFDPSRGLANNPNISFGPNGLVTKNRPTSKFGVMTKHTSTYDILRLTPSFDLVNPLTLPNEERPQDFYEFPEVEVTEFIPPDDEQDPSVPDRYLRAEEEESKRQMEKLQIKKGTIIDKGTVQKIIGEEGGDDDISLTPIVSGEVPDVTIETKNLEDSSNESDNSGEKSSTPKVVLDKDLKEKLDSNLPETSDDKNVGAVQKLTGVLNKTTQYDNGDDEEEKDLKDLGNENNSSDIFEKLKKGNKEETKDIKTKTKEKKKETPKVETKEPNYASAYIGGFDQNEDYLYELVPGWRTVLAGGDRKDALPISKRREFWDEMIEPQRDLNKITTAKAYDSPIIYAYDTSRSPVNEKTGYATSDESVVKESFAKLKGQFDDSRSDGDGSDVVWTPRFSRPNPNGKSKSA